MLRNRVIGLILLPCLWLGALHANAQRTATTGGLAQELCSCIGAIDPVVDNATLDLAVRHCLNQAMTAHSAEVIDLISRFPVQERRPYLLGMLLGGSLERTCPQYPLIKDRLRLLMISPSDQGPNT